MEVSKACSHLTLKVMKHKCKEAKERKDTCYRQNQRGGRWKRGSKGRRIRERIRARKGRRKWEAR